MSDKKIVVWGSIKVYEVGKPDSLVGVFPKPLREELGLSKGDRFHVKTESEKPNRIIFERIQEGKE